jgi:hypothetical protein
MEVLTLADQAMVGQIPAAPGMAALAMGALMVVAPVTVALMVVAPMWVVRMAEALMGEPMCFDTSMA